MKTTHKKTLNDKKPFFLIVLLVVFLAQPGAGQDDGSPEELFRKGSALIEKHCGECQSASREGLEEGQKLIERALERGYSDRVAALRQLEDAQAQIAFVFAQPDSPDQARALAEQKRLLAELVELEADDPELLMSYALIAGPEASRKALERILALDSDHQEALFALGLRDVQHGDTDAGLERMERAFRLALTEEASRDAEYYGSRLLWTLQALDRDTEAENISQQLQQLETQR